MRCGNSRITEREEQYRFLDCPDTDISSDIGKSTDKIDGCFVPVGYRKHDKIHTSKIAVACALNIRDDEMAQVDRLYTHAQKYADKNESIQNNIQLLLANIQMMNSDIGRTYSFGITIDGCVMKLWYFSRSHSAVSEPVNYIDNPKFLIKAFMSFMFATPQEMGFDDTITRHPNGNFTYTVSGRHFRTLKCISALRSDDITGRMTRVWSVNEVESTAEHAPLKSRHKYVLKDVWLEETALTEREIQTEIFNDIERFWNRTLTPSKDRNKFKKLCERHEKLVNSGEYKKHFLTIETDAIQQVTKKAVNKNQKLELFELPKSSRDTTSNIKKDSKLPGRVLTHVDLGNIYPVEPARRKANIKRDFAPRKQYRVVFREKCETVGRLKTLGEVFDVVKDTLIPLQLMFCAGWVHRDISSGNILAYKPTNSSQWIAKLSDLEYAKRFPPYGLEAHKSDPITGTPFFMPTEILLQRYLFVHLSRATDSELTETSHKETNLSDLSDDEEELNLSDLSDHEPEQAPPQPMVHNFQHDLECLWWLLLWSMTSRVNHQPSQQYAKLIFCNDLIPSNKRVNAILYPIKGNLRKVLIQPTSTILSRFMELVRVRLISSYSKLENQENKDRVFDSVCYPEIHNEFHRHFKALYKEKDTSWRAIELQLPSDQVDTAGPSAPVMTQQPSTSRPQEDERTRDLGDVYRSTAGSSSRVERRESMGKGKRRGSHNDDGEQQSGPSVAPEEDRPLKKVRRSP